MRHHRLFKSVDTKGVKITTSSDSDPKKSFTYYKIELFMT